MTALILISIASLLTSLLTFFSGFGLGTIMLPVFAIWFPLEIAVAMTAIVHLLNNLFKFYLVRKHVDKNVAMKFGVPAIMAAFIGAFILNSLSHSQVLMSYEMSGKIYDITTMKLVMSVIMVFFTLFEIIPSLKKLAFDPKFLPVGGVLSGFFGGLSGHQGALRSAFLSRSGLNKESFIATGTVIACMVDLSRLAIYSSRFHLPSEGNMTVVSVALATVFAFIGAYVGSKVLKKVTMDFVQNLVSAGIIVLALLLGMGVI